MAENEGWGGENTIMDSLQEEGRLDASKRVTNTHKTSGRGFFTCPCPRAGEKKER